LRLMRMLKLTKVMRLCRVMRLFQQLRVLVNSVTANILSLIWSLGALVIVMLAATLFMTQAVSEYLGDANGDREVQLKLFPYFGRIPQSLLTLYQMTLASGIWAAPGRLLIFEVSPLYMLFFVFFGWFVSFAMVNVISAIFLKQTLAAAAGDSDTALRERQAKKDADIAVLRSIFTEGDRDASGTIDWTEFKVMIRDHRVRAWLGALDFTAADMATIFTVLDDGDGQIEFDEFIDGVMRCKGHARGIDALTLLSRLRQITMFIEEIAGDLQVHVESQGLAPNEPEEES